MPSPCGTLVKMSLLIGVLVAVLLLCTSGSSATTDADNGLAETGEVQGVETLEGSEVAAWTVLIYLDADNNLERYGIEDFLEMSSVGSTLEMNIVVQMDRWDGFSYGSSGWVYYPTTDSVSYGDWKGCVRFKVEQGMTPSLSSAYESLGEVDMGSPSTLSDFIAWGIDEFPAEHYMLVLWDHGGGWHGVCLDENTNPAGILTLQDLKTAMDQLEVAQPGAHIDVIDFDACQMASLEVYDELSGSCDYIVGSMINEPGMGQNYELSLGRLASDPSMSPSMLAFHFANDFLSSFTVPIAPYFEAEVTSSVLNMTYIEEIKATLVELADSMIVSMDGLHNYYSYCLQRVERYYDELVDVKDLCYLLASNLPEGTVRSNAVELWTLLDTAIEFSGANDLSGGEDVSSANGLTIYYPLSSNDFDGDYRTSGLNMTASTPWDEMVIDHYAHIIGLNDPVHIGTYSPMLDPTIPQGSSQTFTVVPIDSDPDQLSYRWYIDGVLQDVYTSSMTVVTGPATTGTYDIDVTIWDGLTTASRSWELTVTSEPDIIVTGFVLENEYDEAITDMTAGHTSHAHVTVSNAGGYDAAQFHVTCYVDSIELCDWNLALSAGQTVELITTDFMLYDVMVHNITFSLDTTDAVQESNEANNQVVIFFDVVRAKWTLLIYMDGDNNLEQYMVDNFLEMAEVGSSDEVSIVVQFDRRGSYDTRYGDWTGCYRYLVNRDMTPTSSNALMSLGEVNMGDGATFASFLDWGVKIFQADRYIVVLKDHGASWMGCCSDDTSNGDMLRLSELGTGFDEVLTHTGEPIDLVIFDDCLMGSIEIATEYVGMMDYAIVSETMGWTSNYDYGEMLAFLSTNPDLSTKDVTVGIVGMMHIVDDATYITQSVAAYDMQRVGELRSAFREYCIELYRCYNETPSNVQLARFMSEYMDFLINGPGNEVIDLHQFVSNSMACCGDDALNVKAQALLDLLGPRGGSSSSFIIAQRNTDAADFCHGMSIYFPIDLDRYNGNYVNSGWFGASSSWHVFLPNYLYYNPPYTSASASGTVGDDEWFLSPALISFSVTDLSGSGIAWTRYSLDGGAWQDYSGPFLVSSDGVHSLEFCSMNNAGIIESVKAGSVKIDANAPSIDAVVSAGSVTLLPFDGCSGVRTAYYRIDGGSWIPYTVPFLAEEEGWLHTVEFYCVDIAGNSCGIGTVTVGTDDAYAPTTTIGLSGVQGSNAWFVGPITVTLTAYDDGGSGVKVTYYRIDSGQWTAYNGPFVISANGQHSIEYYSVDNFDNVEAASLNRCRIDSEVPTLEVTMTGTGANGFYNGAVTVTLTPYDNVSGIEIVRYRLNGGEWTTYTAPFSINIERTNTIEILAKDLAGNLAEIETLEVIIDTTDPIVSFIPHGLNAEGWGNVTAEISIEAVDQGSGIMTVYYRIDGGDWTVYAGDGFAFEQEGSHELSCYAVDQAGNIGPMVNLTCFIDMSAPIGEIELNGLLINGDFINRVFLNLTYTDEGIGSMTIYYRLDGADWLEFQQQLSIDATGDHELEYYAIDGCGNIGEVFTASFSINIATCPGQVTGLTVEEDDGKLVLTWSSPQDGGLEITCYKIYRSSEGGEMLFIAECDGLQYEDREVERGVQYSYSIVAENEIGEGLSSGSVEASLADQDNSYLMIIGIIISIIAVSLVALVLFRKRK